MIAPLGKFTVTVPGTLVRIYTPPLPGQGLSIHAIQFQAAPTNQGIVYVGTAGLVRSTLANVFGLVARPSYDADGKPVALPAWAAAHTIAPNGLNLETFYIDADEASDAVIVTYIRS